MIDTESAMLARLIGQADAGRGDLVTLRALAEEACELGAERALKRLGLADEKARADMPDVASNSFSVAFGNFKAGYLIAERAETVILRDPFSNKPFVHFYATKRIGGTVSNSEAIKLMKFAAS